MAWRFRKSFSPIPGVRLTLSPSGISTSVGAGPLRLTMGPRGSALTATIPGTGLSFRHNLDSEPVQPVQPVQPRRRSQSQTISGFDPGPYTQPSPAPVPAPALMLTPGQMAPAMQEIRSAGSAALTTAGLADFKAALMQAEQLFNETSRELSLARDAESRSTKLCNGWTNGWIFKRVRKKRYAEIKAQASEDRERRVELDQQLEESRLKTEFELPDGVAKTFSRLCDDFQTMTRSQRIWDNVAHRAANRVAERTTASRIVDLKPVKFTMGKCGVIETTTPVPRLENANGGDLFLYPGFIVYHASNSNYALIEYKELNLQVVRTQFQEEATVPTDAEQVGTTWAKANKDGSPDKRFANNYAIPVMRYARLTLVTTTGLNEEYMLSNVAASEQFATSWKALMEAVLIGR